MTSINKESNNEDPKFVVSDHVRISKYKNIFIKYSIPDWSEEVFVIKKVKILCHGHFMRKNCRKQIKKSSELKR